MERGRGGIHTLLAFLDGCDAFLKLENVAAQTVRALEGCVRGLESGQGVGSMYSSYVWTVVIQDA